MTSGEPQEPSTPSTPSTFVGPQALTMSWEEFCGTGFVTRVDNIRGFRFEGTLSGVGRWTDIIESNRIALRVQGAVEEALESARFMNIPSLETIIGDEQLTFRYTDVDYGFDFEIRGDGRVYLTREGSSLRRFHDWYTRFVPTLPGILARTMDALNTEFEEALAGKDRPARPASGRSDRPKLVRLLGARYLFDVVCHDFRDSDDKKRINLDVMRGNVVERLPDSRGRLPERTGPQRRIRQGDVDTGKYGRMEYTVSLVHEKRPSVVQWLTVSSPSNADWSGLFFTLQYSGYSYSHETADRVPLDPQFFLSSESCADAYITLFRDIGLDGFVASVTKGFKFRTTAGGLA